MRVKHTGKDKKQRYGKLISEPDKVENGQVMQLRLRLLISAMRGSVLT